MNEELKKFNVGDVVLGKVIQIETSKALIKIEGCEPIYIIKEVASIQEIESIEEVLQLNRTYEFSIAVDYGAIYYHYNERYLSIVDLEYSRSSRRIEQLAEENVTIYSEVIQAYDYGVLVRVENKDFIISNIHLKTKISNQELVGTTIPLKIITAKYNILLSHRWAMLNDNSNKNNLNITYKDDSSLTENPDVKQFYAPGDIVVGKIIKLEKNCAWIDVGVEKPAYIALQEMSLWTESSEEVLHLNLIREFIVSIIDYDGYKILSLSIKKLEFEIGWIRLQQFQEENVIFYPQKVKRNRINR